MELKNVRFHIRSICLKNMIYPIVLLFGTTAIFYSVPFREARTPLFVKDLSSVVQLYEEDITYVEIAEDTLYYSGYDHYENGREVASYYFNLYDGIYIFYLISADLTKEKAEVLKNVSFKARLESGGKRLTELIRNMAGDLNWTSQGLAAATAHVLVNEHDYWFGKTMALFYGNCLVALMAGMAFLYALLCAVYPKVYPSCLKLRKCGELKEQIEQLELEILSPVEVFGDLVITEHYLIECGRYAFQVIPLEQIIWAYKHSSLHRFRRHRITYTLRVWGECSIHFISSGQMKEDTDGVLSYLEEHYPEVEIGYSREKELKSRRKIKERKNFVKKEGNPL